MSHPDSFSKPQNTSLIQRIFGPNHALKEPNPWDQEAPVLTYRQRLSRFILQKFIAILALGLMVAMGILTFGLMSKLLVSDLWTGQPDKDPWFESEVLEPKPLTLFDKPHIAVLNLEGIVGGYGIDASNLETFFKSVKKDPNVKALVLWIDSPGGGANAANKISDELARLKRERKDLPIYAYTEGMMASGGYWIASGADYIEMDASAAIGSIGVYFNRKNYSKLLDTIGIKDTTIKEGKYKYDSPMRPENPVIANHLKTELVDEIYRMFTQDVIKGRKGRINKHVPKSEIFSGGLFLPRTALRYGLVDKVEPFDKLLTSLQIKLNPDLKDLLDPPKPKPTKGDASKASDKKGKKKEAEAKKPSKDAKPLPIFRYWFNRPSEDRLNVMTLESFNDSKLQDSVLALDPSLTPSNHKLDHLVNWLLSH